MVLTPFTSSFFFSSWKVEMHIEYFKISWKLWCYDKWNLVFSYKAQYFSHSLYTFPPLSKFSLVMLFFPSFSENLVLSSTFFWHGVNCNQWNLSKTFYLPCTCSKLTIEHFIVIFSPISKFKVYHQTCSSSIKLCFLLFTLFLCYESRVNFLVVIFYEDLCLYLLAFLYFSIWQIEQLSCSLLNI